MALARGQVRTSDGSDDELVSNGMDTDSFSGEGDSGTEKLETFKRKGELLRKKKSKVEPDYEIEGISEEQTVPQKSDCYKRTQWLGQEAFMFTASMTPAIFFSQFLPSPPPPFHAMVEVGAPAANYVVTKALMWLTNHRKELTPHLESARTKCKRGLVVVFGATLNLAAVAGLGFGAGVLQADILNPNATDSNSTMGNGTNINGTFIEDSEVIIRGIVTVDAFRIAAFGSIGYGVNRLGTAVWQHLTESNRAEANEEDLAPLGHLQIMGQYLMRYFGDVTLTETVLFYLRTCGQEQVANSPSVMIAILLASDMYLSSLHYFSFNPNPVESLMKLQPWCGDKDEDDVDFDFDANAGSHYKVPVAVKSFLKYSLSAGVFYGIATITCAVPVISAYLHGHLANVTDGLYPHNGTHYPIGPFCDNSSLGSRMETYLLAGAAHCAFNFVVDHGVDLAVSAKALVRGFCGSLFRKRSEFPGHPYQALNDGDAVLGSDSENSEQDRRPRGNL